MRRFVKAAAVAAMLTMPASAMAAVVTQSFSSSGAGGIAGAQGTEWTTPDGFITLTSTGGPIYFGSDRVGVAKPGEASALGTTLNIGESLQFTFAAPVTDVTFTRNGGTFPVNLTSYDASGAKVYETSASFPNSLPTATVVNGPENKPILSFLLQGVTGTGAGITSITYTTIPAPAPVPLPAAGLLLVGGIAAMAGVRGRKPKAA